MKKLLLILCLLSVSLFANIGKITALQGEVYIQRDTKQIDAIVGSILELKDKLITKDQSKALLLFNDKTSISVGKNSTMDIENFVLDLQQPTKSEASFNFGKGLFRTITGQIGKINKDKFKIQTKSASIGIRGTVFDVVVSDDATKVGVIEGGVYYVDTTTMKSFDIKEGEKLVYDDTTGSISVATGQIDESKEIDKDSQEMKKEEKKFIKKEETKEEEKKEEEVKQEEKQEEEKTVAKEETQEQQEESTLKDEKESVETKEQQVENPAQEEALPAQTVQAETQIPTESTEIGGLENVDVGNFDQDIQTVNIGLENTSTQPNSTPTLVSNISQVVNTVIDTEPEPTEPEPTEPTEPEPTEPEPTEPTEPNPEQISEEITTITSGIAEITGDLLPQDNLDNLDYGFVVPTGETSYTNATDTYVRGTITPDAVIQNYISSGATASYTGGISALVNGTPSSGTINLNVNFGTQSVAGNLNITQGDWQGTINSGTVNPTGFSSTNITGTSSYGSITSGTMDGKFYGTAAQNVGGTLNLKAGTNSATGVFGGQQQ